MPGPVTSSYVDQLLEQHGMRKHGMLGRGSGMGNSLFAIDYDRLPPEARRTISLIVAGGPFPYPGKDGTRFGNRFGDLPDGRYLEYTVRTPGVSNRGKRRIVARLVTGQLFFTACHYERVQVTGGSPQDRASARMNATTAIDSEWRNGFYIITGMPPELRNEIWQAIKALES